jgi:hypothetical protein
MKAVGLAVSQKGCWRKIAITVIDLVLRQFQRVRGAVSWAPRVQDWEVLRRPLQASDKPRLRSRQQISFSRWDVKGLFRTGLPCQPALQLRGDAAT